MQTTSAAPGRRLVRNGVIIFPEMKRRFRALLVLTALVGFLPSLGAAGAACQSGMMPAASSSAGTPPDGMAPMGSHGQAQDESGPPCTTPDPSHPCDLMAPCVTFCLDRNDTSINVEQQLLPNPAKANFSRPESRTVLPELPPPRA